MASFAESLAQLQQLKKDAEQWKTGPLYVSVSKSIASDEIQQINLTDTLGHGKNCPTEGRRSDRNCYWLPPQFNKNNEEWRRKELYPFFHRACRAAGFKVICNHRANTATPYVLVKCNCGKSHDEEQNAMDSKRRKEKEEKMRATKEIDSDSTLHTGNGGERGEQKGKSEENAAILATTKKKSGRRPKAKEGKTPDLCTFKFCVWFDAKLGRWMLPKQQSGCVDHCGHSYTDPSLLRMAVNQVLSDQQQQLARDSLKSHISSTATNALIETHTGETLEWHQIHYMKTKERDRLVVGGGKSTAADRLIAYLRSDPSISYMLLFAEYDSGLLKIRTTTKASTAEEIDEICPDLDLGDDDETPRSFAETKRRNLINSENGQLLLAAAWTNDEARRQFDMFPEFVGADDTEDTNSEERPLFNLCGKNNENQVFALMRCFMPSKAQWAFTWNIERALPGLHPGTALQRVESFLSDADPQETRAIERAVGSWRKHPSMLAVGDNYGPILAHPLRQGLSAPVLAQLKPALESGSADTGLRAALLAAPKPALKPVAAGGGPRAPPLAAIEPALKPVAAGGGPRAPLLAAIEPALKPVAAGGGPRAPPLAAIEPALKPVAAGVGLRAPLLAQARTATVPVIVPASVVCPNAQHGWCCYHRIDRDFTSDSKYKSILVAAKDSSIFNRVEIDMVPRWLWYFAKVYESDEEIRFSQYLLNHYLTEKDQTHHFGELDTATRIKIREFCTNSFFPHGPKLFEAYFDGMTMGNRTTCINEAEHRGIKYHTSGPRPQDDVQESCAKMNAIDDKRALLKAKKAAFDENANYGKASDREKTCSEFSDYCNRKLVIASEAGQTVYFLFRPEEDIFYVKRDYDRFDTSPDEDLNHERSVCLRLLERVDACMEGVTSSERKAIRDIKDKLLGLKKGALPEYKKLLLEALKYVIPRFEHTRIVKIVRVSNGDILLVCSCRGWKKDGYACPHMYAVLKRYPRVGDAKIRWHSGYRHNYGKNESLSRQYLLMRDRFDGLPGIVISEEDVANVESLLPVGEGDMPEDFFTRSLGRLYLRGKETYWQKNADKFPQNLRQCFGCGNVGSVGMDACAGGDGSDTGGDAAVGLARQEGPSDSVTLGPVAASSQVHHGSQYMVPSQTQTDLDSEPLRYYECPPQGKDPYSDFLHIYQDLCKTVRSNGPEGRAALLAGLNDLRAEQDDIADGKPIKSRKRKHSRYQKCTSPPRKSGKKPTK